MDRVKGEGSKTHQSSAIKWLFGALIAAQAIHSIEEYRFRLFDALAPARVVSEALGFERPAGFIVANVLLVGFGLWCFFARVRPAYGGWRVLAWFWAILELGNGVAHLVLAAVAGGYFPGLITAPLLLIIAGLLLFNLSRR